MNKIVSEWLSEYKNQKTREQTRLRFEKFLSWSGKTPEELSKLDNKEAKHLLLKFQKDMEKEYSDNTILGYISASKMFFEYVGIPINFRRGQLVSQKRATRNYHVFSNGDMRDIFQIANTQYKALIATLASSGFGISDVLGLDKRRIEAEIQRAKSEGREFIFLKTTRKKTNVDSLMILNPLAIEWLGRWIDQNDSPELWAVDYHAVNYQFKELAERSGINLTGRIRLHNIRKWVMSSLVKAGFNEFEVKYIVGKSIPVSDATYLQLEEGIKEKYTKAYQKYLNILPSAHTKETAQANTEELQKLNKRILELETRNIELKKLVMEREEEEIRPLKVKARKQDKTIQDLQREVKKIRRNWSIYMQHKDEEILKLDDILTQQATEEEHTRVLEELEEEEAEKAEQKAKRLAEEIRQRRSRTQQ